MLSLAMTSSGTNPYLVTCVSLAYKIVCQVLQGISPSQIPEKQLAIYTSNPNATANHKKSPTNFKIHLTWPVILAPCTRMQQLQWK